MATVLEIKAKRTMACGTGMYGVDAEATIESATGKTLYAHANWSNEGIQYSVSETSIFDYMTGATSEDPGARFIEVYENLSDAKGTECYAPFVALKLLIDLINGTK